MNRKGNSTLEQDELNSRQGTTRFNCCVYFGFFQCDPFFVICILFTYLSYILGSNPKPKVVYFYFKSKYFRRFNEIYNETMDCIHRFENKQQTKERISMDVIVKIGVVGNFTSDNLKVFPKGKVTYKKVRYF